LSFKKSTTMKRNVISKDNIPQRFELSFWIALWLLLDQLNNDPVVKYSFWFVFAVWVIFYAWIKANENDFNIFEIKEQIDHWINK